MIFNFDSMKLRDVILGFCMLAVTACEEDYSGYVYAPFEEVERLFEEKYAGAEAVLWRNRGKYDEVFSFGKEIVVRDGFQRNKVG